MGGRQHRLNICCIVSGKMSVVSLVDVWAVAVVAGCQGDLVLHRRARRERDELEAAERLGSWSEVRAGAHDVQVAL